MTRNALGVEVPAGSDAFDPQGDMVALGASLAGRVVAPVANMGDRDALLAAVGASTDVPLLVFRNDTRVIEASWGAGFWRLTETGLAVQRSGTPGDKTLAGTSGATLDLIATGDTGGVPSITPNPGGRFQIGIAGQFVAGTGAAAACTIVPVLDGAVAASGSGFMLHTGLGAGASVNKMFSFVWDVMASPGAPHTFNVRAVYSGGGSINFQYMSYQIRGA